MADSMRLLLILGRRVGRAWKEDCVDPLPDRWRRFLSGNASSAVITPLGDGTYQVAVEGRTTGTISRIAPPADLRVYLTRSNAIRLRPPSADILCTRISIPKLAARDLEATTRLNIAVWTPFAADEVYHASSLVSDTSPENAPVRQVEVRCVPRRYADRHIDDLRAHAIEADLLELGSDGRCAVALRNRRTETRRRVRAWSAGLMLLLAVQTVVLFSWFEHRQAVEVERLHRQVEALGQDAHARIAADTHVRAARAALHIISDEVAAHGIETMLERLSSNLPRNAWLRELSVGPDRKSSMTLLTTGEADPAAYIKKTGLYQIDGISEVASPNKGERYYSLDLSPTVGEAPTAP